MGAVHLDRIRRNLTHIDNIGFQRGGIDKRRCTTARKVRLIQRRPLLRGDIEIPDVDLGTLAKDHAIRVDNIDIVAALDFPVDVRGIRACNDIQIVVGFCAAVILNKFSLLDGVILPIDDIVQCG